MQFGLYVLKRTKLFGTLLDCKYLFSFMGGRRSVFSLIYIWRGVTKLDVFGQTRTHFSSNYSYIQKSYWSIFNQSSIEGLQFTFLKPLVLIDISNLQQILNLLRWKVISSVLSQKFSELVHLKIPFLLMIVFLKYLVNVLSEFVFQGIRFWLQSMILR